MEPEKSKREEVKEKESEKPVKYSDDYQVLFNKDFYFSASLWKRLAENKFATFSIIDKNDTDKIKFVEIFRKMMEEQKFNPK